MIKVGILGATGRMGQLILETLEGHSRCQVVAIATSPTNPHADQPFHSLTLTKDPEEVFKGADVVIDFTSPAVTETHLKLAHQYQRPMILGTTSLSSAHEKWIHKVGEVAPIVQAFNTSLGVTILAALVSQAARLLDDSYDVEIHEAHHRDKKDAPSGTSLTLGRAVALGRNVQLKDKARFDRGGKDAQRHPGEIGFSVQRGGHVVGDHSVFFYGDDEVLEFTHRGISRKAYARGAIQAAEWVYSQKPGVYSMNDVLGV